MGRVDSSVSIDVTLFPRMTWRTKDVNIVRYEKVMLTYDGANRMLLRGCRLFQSVINNEVQEKVITPQDAADFAATLQIDEELFVHKLNKDSVNEDEEKIDGE
jgi:hypothetical protein